MTQALTLIHRYTDMIYTDESDIMADLAIHIINSSLGKNIGINDYEMQFYETCDENILDNDEVMLILSLNDNYDKEKANKLLNKIQSLIKDTVGDIDNCRKNDELWFIFKINNLFDNNIEELIKIITVE